MLVQLGAESENGKAKHVSALRGRAFWCDCLDRILSPAPLRNHGTIFIAL
jgi:hypothetical protein